MLERSNPLLEVLAETAAGLHMIGLCVLMRFSEEIRGNSEKKALLEQNFMNSDF